MALLGKIFKKKEPFRSKDTGTALERYGKSFKHAIDGIIYRLQYEHNMIIILTATFLVTLCGFAFKINSSEWLFIIFVCGAIAACEVINSSIEALVDLVTYDYNELAKIAKDTASSASLILCIVAFIGGIVIFLPKLILFFGGNL
jgi:diacylglycerol kinase